MVHFALLTTTFAFALQTGGAPPLPRIPTTGPDGTVDSAAVLAGVVAAGQAFFAEWKVAWLASEKPRRRPPNEGPWRDPSKADLACSLDSRIYVPDWAWGKDHKLRRIASTQSALGVCPNWFPAPDFFVRPPKDVTDERFGIDGALAPEFRAVIRASRERLIAVLDSAAMLLPANALITGQRVRFLVDQGDRDRASKVVRECTSFDWWCNALAGYVLTRRDELREAENFFAAAATGLIDADRCKWTDVGVLLDSAGRNAHAKMSCDERESFNERFWWLVDPLWSEPGNDRRVEQSVRRVASVLHASVGRDERYDWRPRFGGDALEETVFRYGWPTYTYWGQVMPPGLPPEGKLLENLRGVATPNNALEKIVADFRTCERDSSGKIIQFTCVGLDLRPLLLPETVNADGKPTLGRPSTYSNEHDPPAPALGSTIEYSVGRVHLVPTWSALDNPFKSRNADWDLNAPRMDPIRAINWWPQEHYAPARPLKQFDDQQTAVLRRQTGALLAFATPLGITDLRRNSSDTVTALMLASTGPDSTVALASKRVLATSSLTFLQTLPQRPSVISVEIPAGNDIQPAGRSRFGITPPRPLSAMANGETAISEPILLAAPTTLDSLTSDIDAVMPLMLGSTLLAGGTSRVGVYWETYGFTAADSVEITLRVHRVTPLSLAQRAAIAAGIGGDPNAPVVASWKEPDPAHRARTIAGNVTIQMRSVVIDISTLSSGDYLLEVMAGKPGTTVVRSTREFVIR